MTSTALIPVLIGALAILPATATQADFTGTWVLDASRSQGVPEGMATTMTVKQSGDRIEVEFHVQTPMGEQRIPDVYVVDGTETDYRPPIIGEGSGTGKRTSRWAADGSGFGATERATVQGPEGEIAITGARKWTLAPGGDTLTIEMTISSPQGEMQSTRVFTRQKPAAA